MRKIAKIALTAPGCMLGKMENQFGNEIVVRFLGDLKIIRNMLQMVPHGEIGHHCRFKGLKVEEERKVTGKSDMKIGLKCKSNKTPLTGVRPF